MTVRARRRAPGADLDEGFSLAPGSLGERARRAVSAAGGELPGSVRRHLRPLVGSRRALRARVDIRPPGAAGTAPAPASPALLGRRDALVVVVALDDVVGDDGQLRVLPGSRRVDSALGSPSTDRAWLRYRAVVEPRLRHLPCRAGDAVVLRPDTPVAWFPNHGSSPRRWLVVEAASEDERSDAALPAGTWPSVLDPSASAVDAAFDADRSPDDARPRARITSGPQSFDERGFGIVRILDRQDLDALRDVVAGVGLPAEHGFHVSILQHSGAVARELDLELRRVLDGALARCFPDHRILFCAVTSKGAAGPGAPASHVLFHHDVTVVDERSGRPCYLWIPLVDVDETNGALAVVPGSHRWVAGIRAAREFGDRVVTEPFQDRLAPLAETVAMWAGDALAFDPALLHGSGPNRTDQVRPAVTAVLVPRAAVPIHFHEARDRSLVGSVVDDEFFTTHPLGAPVVGRPPVLPWAPSVTEEDYAAALARVAGETRRLPAADGVEP